jgi:hypothetical protein
MHEFFQKKRYCRRQTVYGMHQHPNAVLAPNIIPFHNISIESIALLKQVPHRFLES